MNTHSQFPKITSVLLIFILLTEFTGCYSTKVLTTSDVSSSEVYLIHADKSTLPVDSVTISDGILSGKRMPTLNEKTKTNKSDENLSPDKAKTGQNHIYVMSGSGLKIENNILSVPVQSITRIEQKTPDKLKTGILTASIIIGGVGLIVLTTALIIDMVKGTEEIVESSASIVEACSTW